MNVRERLALVRCAETASGSWENSACHYMRKVWKLLDRAFPILFDPNEEASFLPKPQFTRNETLQRRVVEMVRPAMTPNAAAMRRLVLEYAVEQKLPTAWVCGKDLMAQMILLTFQRAGVDYDRLLTGEWDTDDLCRWVPATADISISGFRVVRWEQLTGPRMRERIRWLAEERGIRHWHPAHERKIRHFVCASPVAGAKLKLILHSLAEELDTEFLLVECAAI
jgi:hypothetical protein